MCIRDSANNIKGTLALPHPYGRLQFGEDLEHVSYTHLDVYKRQTYSRGAGRDEFNVRGFTLFNYDVAYNGLYGISPRNATSLIGIERVEVLRGPNALLNGMAPFGSIGGSINLVPKRAGDEPLNRMTLSYIENNQFGACLLYTSRCV